MSELWKDVNGYENIYQVSNLGRVKSVDRVDSGGAHRKEKILTCQRRPNGYYCVHLSKNGSAQWHSVHRLVAEAFLKRIEGCDVVNHIDNDTGNNRADNLEWTTYEGNMRWAAKQGRMKYNPANLKKAQESHKIPVIAIKPNGERLRFDSQKDAAIALGIKRAGHIAAACRKEYGCKTVGGYEWEYADKERADAAIPQKIGKSKEEQIEDLRARMIGNKLMLGRHLSDTTKQKLSEATGRKIVQYTMDGQKVAEFTSSSDAKKKTGISHTNDVANGNRASAGGFLWEWGE